MDALPKADFLITGSVSLLRHHDGLPCLHSVHRFGVRGRLSHLHTFGFPTLEHRRPTRTTGYPVTEGLPDSLPICVVLSGDGETAVHPTILPLQHQRTWSGHQQ